MQQGMKNSEISLLCLWVAMVIMQCSAVRVDLAQLLGHTRNMPSQKRIAGGKKNRYADDTVLGNPCMEPDQPWPCRETDDCIPMGYICDDNYDCPDGSDEDILMCTAKARPPVEDIVSFLTSQKKWIIPKLFDNINIYKVAHGLAVSQTVEDFKRRIGMSSKSYKNLLRALKDIKKGNEYNMEEYGMPASSWNEVNFFFLRLIKAGFA